MTTIIPISRGEDPRLALDLLSDHLRGAEDHGVFIPASECATIAALIERVAVRLMMLEGVENAARARMNAEAGLKRLADVEPEPETCLVDLRALEAAIATGKVLPLPMRAHVERPGARP
ncbi:MAG: hypothetical protein DI566_13345 [Microbacterium sp.]|nr:MAG: hypothetical protein DI566_13345 [Microbacterium sp.]